MKKILSLALVLLMAMGVMSAFTFGVSAADPIVVLAKDLTGKACSDPEKNIEYPAELASDGSLRLKFLNSTTVGKMQFNKKIDKSVYKFIKVRYKYNFSATGSFKSMLREGHSGGSTNHYLFDLGPEKNVWYDGIAEIKWGTAMEGDTLTFHPVREGSKVNAGDLFYIDYIAFFATKEEAEAFALNDKTYTEPPLVEKLTAAPAPSTGNTETSSNPNGDPIVFEGKAVLSTPYRLKGEEKTEDGRTFLHVTPDPSKEPTSTPKIDKFSFKVDTNIYKYMKICYRTNIDPSMMMKYVAIKDTAKDHLFCVKDPGTWESVIIPLDLGGKPLTQSHFWIFGSNAAEALEGFYNDIEYVGFFPTIEKAEAYKKETSGTVRVGDAAKGLDGAEEPEEEPEIVDREFEAAAGAPTILIGAAILKTPYRLKSEEITDEDGKTYLHITPDPSKEPGSVPKVDNYSMNVDTDVYKYLKIEYRTNLEPGTELIYDILRAYKKKVTFPVKSKDKWESAIIELDNVGDAIVQAHFSIFGNTKSADIPEGTYTDIAYVGYFATEEEAKNYGGGSVDELVAVTADHAAYMTGYTDGTFKPNKTMSRAEACTVVARILESEDKITGTPSFADSKTHWGAKYIGFCEAKGLLGSYSGDFLPDQNITRAEFAELVYNTGLAKPDEANKKTFTDVKEDHPKYAAIMAAASSGLVGGYEDGTFLPDRTITRAQVVTVINRALGRSIKELTVPYGYPVTAFSDVPADHWAYGAIAEATTAHKYYMGTAVSNLSYELWAAGDVKDGTAKIAEIDKLAEEKKTAIINHKSEYDIKGKTYYISSINGDDANDGLSPETPFKTVQAVNKVVILPGDAVLFERGSLFRGHFSARANCLYGAYGEGPKPMFYASPYDGAVTGKWTATAENPNIWLYDGKFKGDVGTIIFNHGEEVAIKKCFKEDAITFLKQNFDFWYDTANAKVYLYFDKGNPQEHFDSIEFNEKGNVFGVSGNNITFDNLCIKYGGSHGIGTGGVTNVHVTNCEFGYIGGSMQNKDARFGNAVEFWAPSKDCSVKNCYVYEVYDAGITFQMKGTSGTVCDFENIVFEDNLIERCVYNIEYFLRQEGTDKDYIYNTVIRNNILRFAGEGWGVQRPDGTNPCAHIKGWDSENRSSNFVIEGNIFDRGSNWLIHIGSTAGSNFLPIMKNNTYIQYENGKFGRWNGVEIRFDDIVTYSSPAAACENTTECYKIAK